MQNFSEINLEFGCYHLWKKSSGHVRARKGHERAEQIKTIIRVKLEDFVSGFNGKTHMFDKRI